MSKFLSDKLKAISFLLILMIVFLHSYNLKVNFKSGIGVISHGYNSFFQDIISQGIARIAVPLFFMISGYLFFINIKGTLGEFILKYKRRFKSLVIPYLLWSIYALLFFLTLQSLPFSRDFFSHELISNYSLNQLLRTIFIKPLAYQLWFIRDLALLVVLSPIIYWSIRYFKLYIVLIFFTTWMFSFDYIIFSNESLFFFYVGAFISIKNINIEKNILVNKYLILSAVWMVLIVVKTFLNYFNADQEVLIIIFHKLSIIFGVISIWCIYDRIFKYKDISASKYFTLFQYTFFLYAFHEPLLIVFKKGLYFMLGLSELSSFLIYFMAPIMTILVSLLIGYWTKILVPKFYNIMTGGR